MAVWLSGRYDSLFISSLLFTKGHITTTWNSHILHIQENMSYTTAKFLFRILTLSYIFCLGSTSFPGSLILPPPWSEDERPWERSWTNCWRRIDLSSILANFFTNIFVLVNSYLTSERLANVCWWLSTNQNTRSAHVICVTLHKIADGREDERAFFQFIDEIQNCPDLWDVSSAAYKGTRSKGQISTDIGFVQTFSLFQRFLFLLRWLTYNRTKTQAQTLRECHWHYVGHVANLACVGIWHEFDVWTHEYADFLKLANTILQTWVCRVKAALNCFCYLGSECLPALLTTCFFGSLACVWAFVCFALFCLRISRPFIQLV